MSGFYVLPRGWMDHPVFGNRKREPLSRHAAWVWLIEHAAFADNPAKGIKRGQIAVSLRYLVGQWGWNTMKVARFISAIQRCDIAEARTDTGRTVITICNYDQFSAASRLGETGEGVSVSDDRDATVTGTKEGKKNPLPIGKGKTRARKAEPEGFAEWYLAYPHKVGRPDAARAYQSALARASPADLVVGLRRYIDGKPIDRPWLNPATFLNQDRWLDQPAPNGGTNGHGNRKLSPAGKLFAGFAAAAGYDSGLGSEVDEPLLDLRRFPGNPPGAG